MLLHKLLTKESTGICSQQQQLSRVGTLCPRTGSHLVGGNCSAPPLEIHLIWVELKLEAFINSIEFQAIWLNSQFIMFPTNQIYQLLCWTFSWDIFERGFPLQTGKLVTLQNTLIKSLDNTFLQFLGVRRLFLLFLSNLQMRSLWHYVWYIIIYYIYYNIPSESRRTWDFRTLVR